MPRSRRARAHPPVARPADHAVTEAAFLNRATTTALDEPTAKLDVPHSPAALWASASRVKVSVDKLDGVPDRLRGLVGEVVTVTLHH